MGSNSFLDPKYDGLSAKEAIRQVYRDNLLEDQTKALEKQAELIKKEQDRVRYEQMEKARDEYERAVREKKKTEIYEDYYNLLEKIEYSKEYFTHQYGKNPKADKLYEAQFGTFKEWITNHKKLEILKKKADYEWNLCYEILEKTQYDDYYLTEERYNSIGIYPPKITDGILIIFISFILIGVPFLPMLFIGGSDTKSGFNIVMMILGGLFALVLLVSILENIGKISAYKQKTAKEKLQWKKDKAWYDNKMEEAKKERCKFDEIINAIELFNNNTENFSTSLIQKELKMGYARAEKIYNELIELGIVDDSIKKSENRIEKINVAEIKELYIKEDKKELEEANIENYKTVIETENDIVNVMLYDAGIYKIKVISVIRTITGISLKEAKLIVDKTPSIIKRNITREEAKKIKSQFEKIGAIVEIVKV